MPDPFATRFNPPFTLTPPAVFWLINPFTVGMIDDLRKQSGFKNLGVAIIDLTHRGRRADGAGFTTFAGWNMHEQRFIASLAKIAAMFAAFRLRENLSIAVNQVNSDDSAELMRIVTNDWRDVVETAVSSGHRDFPALGDIFTIGGRRGGWTVDFKKDYLDHMKKMIGHSDNHSASVCIDRLGFQYINGALAAEGLYDPLRGGLWLGGNYASRNWMKEPRTKLTHMGGTASSVATFLTLLEDNRLVSPRASKEMRGIMALAGTWFVEGLSRAKPPRPVSSAYAKVGLAGTAHDCAVIERSADGRPVRYAAVCLSAKDPQIIRNLAVKLDDYIVASN